jgi:phosphoribosylformylglycinamidine (FGAM) synthase-like enzyme
LFGESQSRAIVSIDDNNEKDFLSTIKEAGLPHHCIGNVTEKDAVIIDGINYGSIQSFSELYHQKIPSLMDV